MFNSAKPFQAIYKLNASISAIQRSLFLLLALFLIPLAAHAHDAKPQPPKDTAEAEKWLTQEWTRVKWKHLQFNEKEGIPTVVIEGGKETVIFSWVTAVRQQKEGRLCAVYYKIAGYPNEGSFKSQNQTDCEHFYQAFVYLSRQAQQAADIYLAKELANFKSKAEEWRKLTTKPQLLDEAYKHKVLAEEAFKNKDLLKTFFEYESALVIYPTWPEGQFNTALVAAELEHYRSAAFHMQCYLLLTPDAPDAQAAKDKIIIWQDKAQKF